MADAIDNIYQRLASPRDDASFFRALGDECWTIGCESKNENLTETAFYQVVSEMDQLYRDKRISLSSYHAVTFVYQQWSRFRLDIGNVKGWRELSDKGLALTQEHFEESVDWKNSYLFFLYDIIHHTEGIGERWQLLSSSFIPFEGSGKFMDCTKSLCRGMLLMDTALMMERRGLGSDVKSSITLVLKAAEVLRNCYDNHIDIDSPPTSAATALRALSDFYFKNQARYRRFDESMASRIESLLRIKADPVVKLSHSVPKGAKSTHPGIFIAIVASILVVCMIMIFRSLSSDTETDKTVEEQVDRPQVNQVERVAEESHQEQTAEVPQNVSLPSDVTGLYFVPRAYGVSSKGITARISEVEGGRYDMAVYSNMPIRHYSMTLDRTKGLFHSEELGDGYITYDEQTRSITINFSDVWILTN